MTPDANRKKVVLLVDDQAIVAEAIRRMLAEHPDLEFHHCADVALALPMARKVRPTVILQDLVMPQVDGFALVRFFRADPLTANVPIIVLSSKEDPRDKSRAFEIGASDYLVKIPDKVELIARVRAHARSYVAQLERDEAYLALAELKAQLETTNTELQRLTVTDELTGLANRRHLDTTLDIEWRRAMRERTPLSLLLIDIDYFKRYNDTYGHQSGDRCLRQVAGLLKSTMRYPADLPARYGGEEFAVVLPSTRTEGAATVAQRLLVCSEELAIPHSASEVSKYVTLSIGVSCHLPTPEHTASDLVASADAALYSAKLSGRNRHCISSDAPD